MIETERLLLRMWKAEDFDAYAEMCADLEVMRFLGPDGKPMRRFDAWRSFCIVLGHWQLRGYGMFAVVERASGELAGRIGPWQPEDWPGFEIGWTLKSKFWGRGYAAEAVRAAIEYSFTALDQPRVISVIDPENVRSIHVAERTGERLEGSTHLPHMPGKDFLCYGIDRKDWKRGISG